MNCKLINIIWIERGILLSIIYYIIKNYDKLKDMTIIIEIKDYRKILRILFKKINIQKYKEDNPNNFYFNIRTIIKKQDVIIDYMSNYNIIHTKKIDLVPWYDMNDILILYHYNIKYNLDATKYKIFITNFSKCRRSNYNNMIWDMYIELKILKKYSEFNNNYTVSDVFNHINQFIKSNYTNPVNNYYIPYEIPYIIQNNIKPSKINNNINSTIKSLQQITNNVNTPHITNNVNTNITTENILQPTNTEQLLETPKHEPEQEKKEMFKTIENNDDILNELITLMNNKINNLNNLII